MLLKSKCFLVRPDTASAKGAATNIIDTTNVIDTTNIIDTSPGSTPSRQKVDFLVNLRDNSAARTRASYMHNAYDVLPQLEHWRIAYSSRSGYASGGTEHGSWT